MGPINTLMLVQEPTQSRGRVRNARVLPIRKPRGKRNKQQHAGPDPTGRIDIAMSRLFDEFAKRNPDPLVQAAYRIMQPDVDKALGLLLGPQTKAGKIAHAVVNGIRSAAVVQMGSPGTDSDGSAA